MNTTLAVVGIVLFGLVAMIGAIFNSDLSEVLVPISTAAMGILAGVAGSKGLEKTNP